MKHTCAPAFSLKLQRNRKNQNPPCRLIKNSLLTQPSIVLVLGYLMMRLSHKRFGKARFASASHAGKSILPIGTVKILNLSDDTITVTASSESDDNLKIVVPPHSEGVLTSNGLSDVQASTSGGASKVTFLFISFSQGILVQIKNHKKVQLCTVPFFLCSILLI